jgi:hypothetical protein
MCSLKPDLLDCPSSSKTIYITQKYNYISVSPKELEPS